MKDTHGRSALEGLKEVSVKVEMTWDGGAGAVLPLTKSDLKRQISDQLKENGFTVSANGSAPRLVVNVAVSSSLDNTDFRDVGVSRIATALEEKANVERNGKTTEIDTWRHRLVNVFYKNSKPPSEIAGLIQARVDSQIDAFISDRDAVTAPETPVAAGTSLPTVQKFCNDYDQIRDNDKIFQNNTWGSGKVPKNSYQQCLQKRSVNGNDEYGWSWSWPGHDPTIYAYPEVIFGAKPFKAGMPADAQIVSTTDRLPKQIKAIKTLVLDYEIEMTPAPTGWYNLAPEMWITNVDANLEEKAIQAEVMIWLTATGLKPAGKCVGEVVIDGVTYSLFQGSITSKTVKDAKWDYFAFVANIEKPLKLSLPLHEFLNNLTGRTPPLVNAEHYVASVDFGNEIGGGTGTTWVKSVSLKAT